MQRFELTFTQGKSVYNNNAVIGFAVFVYKKKNRPRGRKEQGCHEQDLVTFCTTGRGGQGVSVKIHVDYVWCLYAEAIGLILFKVQASISEDGTLTEKRVDVIVYEALQQHKVKMEWHQKRAELHKSRSEVDPLPSSLSTH